MTLKVGTLCYAADSGLGILAKAFYDNGVVTHPVVVRHGRHPTHDEWYPGAPQITNLKSNEQLFDACQYLRKCDVVLFFETPFRWEIVGEMKKERVRTALMPMYECMPEKLPATPDLFVCPSILDWQFYPPSYCWDNYRARSVFIPVPVSVPWRQRTRAEVFVHNAGHGGLKGRNGTLELLQTIRMVKSPAKFIIRYQDKSSWPPYSELLGRVDYREDTLPYDQLYTEGDVFVFPEKFNGLSLPLQEARAAGMLVMCADRFPMTEWLPREPLIPIAGYRKNRVGPPYNEFDEALIDPKAIAAKIDEWYGRDITNYSLRGKEWAENNSWEKLKPRYLEVLGS